VPLSPGPRTRLGRSPWYSLMDRPNGPWTTLRDCVKSIDCGGGRGPAGRGERPYGTRSLRHFGCALDPSAQRGVRESAGRAASLATDGCGGRATRVPLSVLFRRLPIAAARETDCCSGGLTVATRSAVQQRLWRELPQVKSCQAHHTSLTTTAGAERARRVPRRPWTSRRRDIANADGAKGAHGYSNRSGRLGEPGGRAALVVRPLMAAPSRYS
jgi:hypothetical protein